MTLCAAEKIKGGASRGCKFRAINQKASRESDTAPETRRKRQVQIPRKISQEGRAGAKAVR